MNVHRHVKLLLAVVIVTVIHDDGDVITPDINNYAWLLTTTIAPLLEKHLKQNELIMSLV